VKLRILASPIPGFPKFDAGFLVIAPMAVVVIALWISLFQNSAIRDDGRDTAGGSLTCSNAKKKQI
jgi:hypothetical protein